MDGGCGWILLCRGVDGNISKDDEANQDVKFDVMRM